jgi:hypothetical protein
MSTQKSGFYYPNKIARIYLTSIEELIGPEAMETVLSLSRMPELADRYPPDNMSRQFDFADFSAIGAALETMYGQRGERGLGLHAGKACFNQGVADFASISGIGDLATKTIPFRARLKIGLKAMARVFDQFSDQVTSVTEAEDYFLYTIHRCPVCWGRTSQKPICYVAGGIIQAGLHWFTNGQIFEVQEVTCQAMGAEGCQFQIRKEPVA